jgi:cytochrome b561
MYNKLVDFICLQFRIQLFFYELTKSQKFDIAIMILIMLNMLTMAIEYEEQPADYTEALEWINIVFIILFTAECMMKLLGLRLYYFKEPWNVFDFFIVITSVISKCF